MCQLALMGTVRVSHSSCGMEHLQLGDPSLLVDKFYELSLHLMFDKPPDLHALRITRYRKVSVIAHRLIEVALHPTTSR